MGADDQIMVPGVDCERPDGGRREPVGPEEPVLPPIQAHPETELGAGEQEVGGHGVLFEGVGEPPELVIIGDVPPVPPVVLGPEDVWFPVPATMVVEDYVGRSPVGFRRFDVGDPRAIRNALDPPSHVFPVPST